MTITLDKSTIENLLHHAAFAAHLVGHLDDDLHADLVGHLADHIDAVVHGLTELLGDPHALIGRDAAATDVILADAPMLTSTVGGVP